MDSQIVSTAAKTPARAEDWCEQVRHGPLGLFALINPVSTSIPRPIRSLVEREAVNLFATRTAQTDALEVAPRLLSLALATDNHVPAAIGTQDAEIPWGTLIASPLALPELSKRLCRRIDVMADGKDMMLRYWDSRVLMSLHAALDETTRHRLFAFGEQMLVSDRHGGCTVLESSCPIKDPIESGPLSLDREDMLALSQAFQVDATLSLLRQGNPEALDEIAESERYSLAKSQLEACLEHGLRSPRDHALALSLAIEHGRSWWHDEVWTPVLEQAKQTTLLKAYTDHLEVA